MALGDQLGTWYKEQGEYLTGALFGLVTLDLFMFLVHCFIERTTEGYGLTTLLITLCLYGVASAEQLYAKQEQPAH